MRFAMLACRSTLAAGVLLGLAACGDDDAGSAVVGDQIRISGIEMAFVPAAVTTTPGRHEFVYTNDGAVYHELAVVGPDGAVLAAYSIAAGSEQTFDLDLKAGDYKLLCREPGHMEAGMVGTMTVTP